jgi:malonyl CoA-acyl carrier protein transacylase
MGRNLFDEFPELIKKADTILGYSIKELCLNDEQNQLHQTQYTQPALYVVNALSYQQKIKETGEIPDFVLGHSLGEYNALEASGAISFEDGLKLVKKRGELMSKASKGAMAAVLGVPEEEIRKILEANDLTGIDIANYNSPSQTVISGLEEDIRKAQPLFEKAEAKYIPLKTSGAFHSRYMEDAKSKFKKYLKKFKFSELKIPVISNVHARPYQQDEIASNLSDQINHSVKWLDSIRYLMDRGEMEFEELGVGNVLTKLFKNILEQAAPLIIEDKIAPSQSKESIIEEKEEEKIERPTRVDSASEESVVSETKTANKTDYEREIEELHKKIDTWNKTYPIGTKVTIKGYKEELETRTEAMILFGHRAAIYMQGYNGYFALDEVTPM